MKAAVEIEQLSKTYVLDALKGRRRVVALESLTLSIQPGHVLGVLGPNGAGKSTTIKLLLNLIQPTSGRALLFGRPPSDAEARRQVGYLPENPAPYEYLTGEEFVTLAAQLSGLSGGRLRAQVDAVLAQVQMERFRAVQIRRYSKGMTQRISLAQALVASPGLLILDEPTSGLDVLGRQLIRDIIVSEKRKGTTILLCSHIIPDVEALAEDVAILVGGRLVRSGPVGDLMAEAGSEVELTLEGVPAEALAHVGPQVVQATRRLVVRCPAAESRRVVEAVWAAGGTLVAMHPIRRTLEDTFLEAMKSSQTSVGSSIE